MTAELRVPGAAAKTLNGEHAFGKGVESEGRSRHLADHQVRVGLDRSVEMVERFQGALAIVRKASECDPGGRETGIRGQCGAQLFAGQLWVPTGDSVRKQKPKLRVVGGFSNRLIEQALGRRREEALVVQTHDGDQVGPKPQPFDGRDRPRPSCQDSLHRYGANRRRR